ncbi:hypothetical protein B0T20DRAFT_64539 [Sordaria brevicollis]|uniref:Uncharacterized protein n=1 Tax=Sordaria brevicollis TaxID=83679 RepID=A0AAE0P1X4_SORBR|nr:hypothetical protein B0T20DRAFT_64539 [Sordaria brevicollis]
MPRCIETTYNVELPPATLPCPPDRPPTSVSSVTSTIPSLLQGETGTLNRTNPTTHSDETKAKTLSIWSLPVAPVTLSQIPDSPRDPLEVSPFLRRPILAQSTVYIRQKTKQKKTASRQGTTGFPFSFFSHCVDPRPYQKGFQLASPPASSARAPPLRSAWPRKWASENRNRNRNRQEQDRITPRTKTGLVKDRDKRGSRPAPPARHRQDSRQDKTGETGSHRRQPPPSDRVPSAWVLPIEIDIHCHHYPQPKSSAPTTAALQAASRRKTTSRPPSYNIDIRHTSRTGRAVELLHSTVCNPLADAKSCLCCCYCCTDS